MKNFRDNKNDIKMRLRKFLLFSLNLISVQCFSVVNRTIIKPTVMDTSERPSFEKYKTLRQDLLDLHLERALGSDVVLNEREKKFNSILMDLKADEISRGFQNPFNFTPARHFFDVLESVESSSLFKLIKKMPKGSFYIKTFRTRGFFTPSFFLC